MAYLRIRKNEKNKTLLKIKEMKKNFKLLEKLFQVLDSSLSKERPTPEFLVVIVLGGGRSNGLLEALMIHTMGV